MNQKLSDKLSEKQERLRQQTKNRVLRAISDIKSEGGTVTIAALVEFTELSRSVFAKPHIRALLTEYGYSNQDTATTKENRRKKVKSQSEILAKKELRIVQLLAKNTELEHECELLRGRLFLMMHRQPSE